MHSTALLQTIVDSHHGGMLMGLHWAWWIVWLAIGAALIWALARMLLEPGPNRHDDGAGMMGGAIGAGHMGSGWTHANGTYGMTFTFTTAG